MRSERYRKQRRGKIAAAAAVIIIAAVGIFFAVHQKAAAPTKSKPAAVKTVKNPLTGLALKKGRKLPARPIIVSTDNDSALARPQSGLSRADIVYEVPAEGGASRYEPIYYSRFPSQAGPTRSVRPYIIDIAREYDAILVHNGYSPQAKAYLEENVVPYYPAQKYDDTLFWRSSDRQAPHNQYTDVAKDYRQARKDGNAEKKTLRTFKWYGRNDKVQGRKALEVHVNYPVTANTYKYDAEKKLYARYVAGEVSTDLSNSDAKITCANILVQEVSSGMYDEKRLDIDMTQGGRAYLFTAGKVRKGTWSRDSLDGRTVFKDSDGREFRMTPGTTWIQVINEQGSVSYK
ncbi:MAG: DUF3048 domain-containing protein [Eubacteriales bacterium]|nr:DUF3048 domain-containing protein [Eubacteriales bacterium]